MFDGTTTPMESSSTSTKFRFREADDSTDSDISSVSADNGEESELESMTGKGIKRLCAELLEIKALSDEDFHKNIFTNYSAFLGIIEEVKEMEKELIQLKSQVPTQKKLVKDLIDGAYLKILSEETIESIIQETEFDESSSSNELEAHINDVYEILEILLSENRIDEAIAILEMEEENLHRVQLEQNSELDALMIYKSVISERKAMVTLHLTLFAENSRITAPELQKALVGICRLGESNLATQLLLKYYHLRLANGIHNLQGSRSFLHVVHVKELSRFVFSMISQAAKSFVLLYGETSPFASELILWVNKEIEVFAASFNKYVKSISEVSGRLSAVVESVQFAMSYCSLLECQRLMLRPCLIEHIRPCVEEVLQTHVNHFKKVIAIFTATDAWVLGRYLLSGILNESYSSVVNGRQPEYCLLTSSARKFVTLMQAIIEDVTPLVALQMEDSILRGLMNLVSEYIAILERAISSETNESEKSGLRIILAESMPQQVSILANLSTLENLFSTSIINFYGSKDHFNSKLMKDRSVGFQLQKLESCIPFIQEASARLRAHLFQQFICRMMSHEAGYKLNLKMGVDRDGDPGLVHEIVPSVVFQVLFIELRKLGKLTEDDGFEVDWLMDLSRELIEAIFLWISVNKEIWENNEKKLNFEHPDVLNQFVLDMNFLVEIIRYGEYFSKNPLVPATLMKSAFDSAGLEPMRDTSDDDGWVMKAAIEAIDRLLEIEETDFPSNDEIVGISVEGPPESHSEHGSETVRDDVGISVEEPPEFHSEHGSEAVRDDGSSSEASLVSEEDAVTTDASEVAVSNGKVISNAELNHAGLSPDLVKDSGCSIDNSAMCLTEVYGDLEYTESASAAYEIDQETILPHHLLSASVGESSEVELPTRVVARSLHNEANVFANRLEDDAEVRLAGAKIVSPEAFACLQDNDETNS